MSEKQREEAFELQIPKALERGTRALRSRDFYPSRHNVSPEMIKQAWKASKETGITTINGAFGFFKEKVSEIKDIHSRSNAADQALSKFNSFLITVYEVLRKALDQARKFLLQLKTKASNLLNKTVQLPDGTIVKPYAVLGLGIIGAFVVLSVYKLIGLIKKDEEEAEPALEGIYKVLDETTDFYHTVERATLKEGFWDYVSDKIKLIIEKAYEIIGEVASFFSKENLEKYKDSQVVQMLKKFGPFVSAALAGCCLVFLSYNILKKEEEAPAEA